MLLMGLKLAVKLDGALTLFDLVTQKFEVLKEREVLPFRLLSPRWSPDGKYLIFVGYVPGHVKTYLYKMDLQTLEMEQVLEDSTANWPDWK